MNLSLDDDSIDALLIRRLRTAGHDVVIPHDLGTSGADDPIHLLHAVRLRRVFLTHNHRDFEQLHLLIQETQGHHPGILTVRRDNDQKRDMKPGDIVRAIHNLTTANTALPDQLHILNHWR